MKVSDFANYIEDYENYRTNEADEVFEKIKKCIDKMKVKDKQIEELQYENNLIMKDMLDNIRINLRNSCYNLFESFHPDCLRMAWLYNTSKDKDEETEKTYNFVLHRINHFILKNNPDFELIEIIMYNYGEGYDFLYKYKNSKVKIFIPLFERVTLDNYLLFLNGYSFYIYEDEYIIEQVFSDINYKKFAEKIELWVKNYEA